MEKDEPRDENRIHNSDTESCYENKWEQIGFHRNIAGFFYNYVPALFLAFLFIVMNAVIIPVILPYPDAQGYYEIAKSFYKLMFLIFDAGIGSAIGLFVPKYRITDPKRSLQYISFFIWFQMTSGLVQITMIAIYTFYFMPMSMAHLAWVFIAYSTVQYPGMLAVLYTALRSFQHHGKYIIGKLFQDIFQFATQIGFILLGRWIGGMSSNVGELMGASIGLVIGLYIDDFLAFILTGKLFNDVLKDIGLSVGYCLRPTFTKEIAKESIIYGLKTMPAAIYGNLLGFLSFLITFNFLPQYAAWMGMIQLARNFSDFVSMPGQMKASTEFSISESLNNGKEHLTRYMIGMTLKWRFLLTGFIAISVIILIPEVLRSLLSVFGEEWLPAARILPLMCIIEAVKIFENPVSFTKIGRPGIDQFLGIFLATVSFLFYAGLIYVFKIELTVEIFILKDVPLIIFNIAIYWVFLSWKVMKVKPKDFLMQAVILQIPAMIIYVFICQFYATSIYPLTVSLFGFYAGILVTLIAVLFLFPPFLFCPLVSLFGAWDEYSIKDFEKSIEISGPSKFMLRWMYKTSFMGYKISPLRGKFKTQNADLAFCEAIELEQLKKSKDLENIQNEDKLYM